MKINLKRAYIEASDKDGYRVLIDRLWPRGLSKVKLHVDEWAKDLAPSQDLRLWFAHKPERFEAFQKKYLEELKGNEAVEEFVKNHKKIQVITLIYAAKELPLSHAPLLQKFLLKKFLNK
ncbi:MAG: DUF488 domain-containing protein [Bacteroidetes bacterium]|nr:MAG: DUF488 domain-containing protein [Bacteroidota bacterium]